MATSCSVLDLSPASGVTRHLPLAVQSQIAANLCLDDTPVATAKRLPGESEEERDSSGRLWRTVIIGDQEQRIDMQVIRPYLNGATPRRKMPGISWLKKCQRGSSGPSWPSQDLSSGEDSWLTVH